LKEPLGHFVKIYSAHGSGTAEQT